MHHADELPAQLLNRLLRLNYSRYCGYQLAGKQTDISVLQVLFERLTDTSAACSEELCKEIYKIGGRPDKRKLKGPFETAWSEINKALVNNNHMALLDSCYCEEQMSYKLYEYTIRYYDEILNSGLKQLFKKHKTQIETDHQSVLNLRHVLLDAA